MAELTVVLRVVFFQAYEGKPEYPWMHKPFHVEVNENDKVSRVIQHIEAAMPECPCDKQWHIRISKYALRDLASAQIEDSAISVFYGDWLTLKQVDDYLWMSITVPWNAASAASSHKEAEQCAVRGSHGWGFMTIELKVEISYESAEAPPDWRNKLFYVWVHEADTVA